MKLRTWLAGAAGAVTLCLAGTPAQAIPAGDPGDANAAAGHASGVHDATWRERRRWRRYYGDGAYRYRYRRRYYYSGPRYYYRPRFGPERPKNRFQRWHWRDRNQHGGR